MLLLRVPSAAAHSKRQHRDPDAAQHAAAARKNDSLAAKMPNGARKLLGYSHLILVRKRVGGDASARAWPPAWGFHYWKCHHFLTVKDDKNLIFDLVKDGHSKRRQKSPILCSTGRRRPAETRRPASRPPPRSLGRCRQTDCCDCPCGSALAGFCFATYPRCTPGPYI